MSNIFKECGSSIDPNTSTIIVGILQICGTYTAALLVDTYGRKILMLWSTGGMAFGLSLFGLFTNFALVIDMKPYSIVPIVLMGIVVFLGNMGLIALTFVILVEIFPHKVNRLRIMRIISSIFFNLHCFTFQIRSIAMSVSMAILSFFVFAMLKIFPLYMKSFGISMTVWSCSAVCIISFIYLLIFFDETKGKSMDFNYLKPTITLSNDV